MSEFANVTVIREANIYFEGKVTSRSILFPDGSRKTLGVMLPGDYEFGTDKKEIMEIMSGELEVLLPGTDQWKLVQGGEAFEVPGKAKFGLKVRKVADYCCSYVD
jgi:purine/pyrimidine-nucleoside phosphorylase